MIYLEQCIYSNMWMLLNESRRAFAWFDSYAVAFDTFTLMQAHGYLPPGEAVPVPVVHQAQILPFVGRS